MKLLKVLFLVTLLFSIKVFADNREYENNYYALHVGVTPIHEMLEYLGSPIQMSHLGDNIHYFYEEVKVTALKSSGRVSKIAIFDENYTDPKGMRIGSTIGEWANALYPGQYSKSSPHFFESLSPKANFAQGDSSTGIVYWFRDGRIKAIVLRHKIDEGGLNKVERPF